MEHCNVYYWQSWHLVNSKWFPWRLQKSPKKPTYTPPALGCFCFSTVEAKQLGQGLQSLEGATLVDQKTGRIQSKKPKKEKTPEQLAIDELKKMASKLLCLYCFL